MEAQSVPLKDSIDSASNFSPFTRLSFSQSPIERSNNHECLTGNFVFFFRIFAVLLRRGRVESIELTEKEE